MKPQELRELSEPEREEKLRDMKEELFNLKFQVATGKIQNPGRLKHLRRDIARIMTIQNQQKRTAQAADAKTAKAAEA